MSDSSNELEDEIRAQVDEWSSNSNECFSISLQRNDGSEHASFPPSFTYPIFGEEEVIFGYQDLSINLTFAAHDMRPQLDIEYGKAFQAIGEIKPTDIKEAIREFLPAEAVIEAETKDVKSFRPPGQKIKSYQRDGESFEVWCASLSDPEAKRILENMQILVPLMIEGGSILELEQDWTTERWKLFLLYRVYDQASKDDSPYALVGYGTSYRVFAFPGRDELAKGDFDLSLQQELLDDTEDACQALILTTLKNPLELPSRERLSQFLILPTFQGQSHGQRLYQVMYTHLTSALNVKEFTVEDPNEAFDDLRDLCDLLHLRAKYANFAALTINTDIPTEALKSDAPIPTKLIVDSETRASLRRTSKIDQRQFDRMIEIQTLSKIPALHRSKARITKKEKATNPHDKAYYLWRLYAKYRLYLHNRDQLMQVDAAERPMMVEGAVDSVVEGYAALLERVEGKERETSADGEGDVKEGAPERRDRKRKVIEEDEEDEEMEDVADVAERKGKEKVAVENGKNKKAKKAKKAKG